MCAKNNCEKQVKLLVTKYWVMCATMCAKNNCEKKAKLLVTKWVTKWVIQSGGEMVGQNG